MKITRMTLLALSDAMQRGDLTSREVTQAYLDRIHQVEGKVQAYISLNEEEALRQADECDKKRQQGEKVSPLCGIPVAVKDNICTSRFRRNALCRCSACSRLRTNWTGTR